MTTLRYALDEGQAKRLEIAIGDRAFCWSISLDGVELGKIEGIAAARQGRTFPLADGRSLFVGLARYGLVPALKVECNGVPVPGAPLHPNRMVNFGSAVLLILGVVNVAGWALSSRLPQMKNLSGPDTLVVGVLLFALGFLSRRRSLAGCVAFALAAAIFAFNAGLIIYANIQSGSSLFSGGAIFRFLFCFWMVQSAIAQKAQALANPKLL